MHVSNVLLAHLHFSRTVPRELYSIEKELKSPQISAKQRYNWMNEESVDVSLCHLAFGQDDSPSFAQANSQGYGC